MWQCKSKSFCKGPILPLRNVLSKPESVMNENCCWFSHPGIIPMWRHCHLIAMNGRQKRLKRRSASASEMKSGVAVPGPSLSLRRSLRHLRGRRCREKSLRRTAPLPRTPRTAQTTAQPPAKKAMWSLMRTSSAISRERSLFVVGGPPTRKHGLNSIVVDPAEPRAYS